MNWSSVASLLADLAEQPLLVVDGGGEVRLLNEHFELLLGVPREQVVGRPLAQLVPAERADQVAAMLVAALQGARRRAEITIQTATGEHVTLMLELCLVTGGDTVGLVCRVCGTRADVPSPALSDTWLQIRIDDDFGRIKYVHGVEHEGAVGGLCYRVVVGSDEPCADCPAAKIAVGESAADLQLLADDRLLVRRARRTSSHTAQVSHTALAPGMVPQLLDARVRALATRCQLSDREREVLAELVAGRPLEDIATLLSISSRTVRFHQTNVLSKLGIDSRLELIRMLME